MDRYDGLGWRGAGRHRFIRIAHGNREKTSPHLNVRAVRQAEQVVIPIGRSEFESKNRSAKDKNHCYICTRNANRGKEAYEQVKKDVHWQPKREAMPVGYQVLPAT